MLPDEKCLSCKTEVYLLLSMFSENCLWSDLQDFLLRPYAATESKPNVSLAELIRCCPFTQGHSGVFRFLLVFISRFVKTGTPTPLLFSSIRSDPAPQKKLNATVLIFVQIFCRTIRESFQYFQVAKVSDQIFLFSRFLIEVLHSSKTTVL